MAREFDCLQHCKTNIHNAIFDKNQNNVEVKSNVALFGFNKTGHLCQIAFKYAFKYLFIHFHCSTINFKLKCMLFHVNKIQFYEVYFRNRIYESTIPRVVAQFKKFMSKRLS